MTFQMVFFQVLLVVFIGFLVLAGKLKHSYALPWTLGILIIPLVLISSNLLETTSKFLGFQLTSNFIFVLTTVFLILNSIWLLSIIGRMEEKISYLAIEITLIKNRNSKKLKD